MNKPLLINNKFLHKVTSLFSSVLFFWNNKHAFYQVWHFLLKNKNKANYVQKVGLTKFILFLLILSLTCCHLLTIFAFLVHWQFPSILKTAWNIISMYSKIFHMSYKNLCCGIMPALKCLSILNLFMKPCLLQGKIKVTYTLRWNKNWKHEKWKEWKMKAK